MMTRDEAPGSRRRLPFAAVILIAMGLGIAAGEVFGTATAPLARLGTVILDLIKGLAGPLLLFAVLDAFLRTHVRARSGLLMIGISAINATLAVAIGLGLSNWLRPGRALAGFHAGAEATAGFDAMAKPVEGGRSIHFVDDLLGLVPTSVVKPFLENAILSIVVLAVLGGLALRRVKSEQLANGQDDYLVVEKAIGTVYRSIEVALAWVVQLVPIAVFGVVAKTVGQWGLAPLKGLAVYLAVGLLGLAIQVVVVYHTWLIAVARFGVRRFWRGARDPVVYAMGTGSSLATLPVTLRALDRMGVSPQSARMAACIGTNLNNDGILLYEAMAVLFVAQACGVTLTVPQQLLAAAACVVAGVGISGIPEAGLISLLLVLKTVDVVPDALVVQIVPLLLTVDWVLGRARAMTNVTSDLLTAVLLDRSETVREGPETPEGWAEEGVTANSSAGVRTGMGLSPTPDGRGERQAEIERPED
jgi:Na+/H+-dicarboxylate symporter